MHRHHRQSSKETDSEHSNHNHTFKKKRSQILMGLHIWWICVSVNSNMLIKLFRNTLNLSHNKGLIAKYITVLYSVRIGWWTILNNNYKCQTTMLWLPFCQDWQGLLLNWPWALMQAHVFMNNSEGPTLADDKRATECKWIVVTDQIDLNGFGEIGSFK